MSLSRKENDFQTVWCFPWMDFWKVVTISPGEAQPSQTALLCHKSKCSRAAFLKGIHFGESCPAYFCIFHHSWMCPNPGQASNPQPWCPRMMPDQLRQLCSRVQQRAGLKCPVLRSMPGILTTGQRLAGTSSWDSGRQYTSWTAAHLLVRPACSSRPQCRVPTGGSLPGGPTPLTSWCHMFPEGWLMGPVRYCKGDAVGLSG